MKNNFSADKESKLGLVQNNKLDLVRANYDDDEIDFLDILLSGDFVGCIDEEDLY